MTDGVGTGPPMVTMAEIERLGHWIGTEFGAERVILFGSYARGTARPDSDVDLLVLIPRVRRPNHKAADIRFRAPVSFPLDVIVQTPAGLAERLALGDGFLAEVVEAGRTVHDAGRDGWSAAERAGKRAAARRRKALREAGVLMKPYTNEWVERAEGDYDTMLREAAVVVRPNPFAVCFHAQQCAEKYLKARLAEAGLPIKKSHDLAELLDEVVVLEPPWESHRADFQGLTRTGAETRYPSAAATADDVPAAVDACRRFRDAARAALGLSD